jgi:hypothetical protein
MSAVVKPGILGDALIGVVDNIRGVLRAALGTRPYRFALIVRTWSGGRVGEGTPTDVITELGMPTYSSGVQPPLIEVDERGRYAPGGEERDGDLRVTELSLSYTEDDLAPTVPPGGEVVYRVTDNHGQKQRERFYILSGQPLARRGDRESDRSDWKLYLRRTSDLTPHDGVDI